MQNPKWCLWYFLTQFELNVSLNSSDSTWVADIYTLKLLINHRVIKLHLIAESVLPNSEQHQVTLVSVVQGREIVFLIFGADLNGVGNDTRCLLLGHRCYVFAPNRQLKKFMLKRKSSNNITVTYDSFPAENIGVETDPVLSDVQTTLDEDVFVKSTGIIYIRRKKYKKKTSWGRVIYSPTMSRSSCEIPLKTFLKSSHRDL